MSGWLPMSNGSVTIRVEYYRYVPVHEDASNYFAELSWAMKGQYPDDAGVTDAVHAAIVPYSAFSEGWPDPNLFDSDKSLAARVLECGTNAKDCEIYQLTFVDTVLCPGDPTMTRAVCGVDVQEYDATDYLTSPVHLGCAKIGSIGRNRRLESGSCSREPEESPKRAWSQSTHIICFIC